MLRILCKALWLHAAALSLFLSSCAGSSEFYRTVEEKLASGEYERALDVVRENKRFYGDKSSVLFNMEMGMLHHYAGKYDSSTQYLLAAEKEIDDLYTKSISQQALSIILNDNVLPYDGEDFERVLINVFLALNFVQTGSIEGALVEARKVDLKLRQYAREYEGKNKYQEDAFIRYVAGALYETDGEINDAFISYRKAHDTYKTYQRHYGTAVPGFLLDDLVRTATLLSFDDEAQQYQSLGGRPFDGKVTLGSVVVLVYTGRGPVKVEERATVTIPDSSGILHTFQIALPKFVPRFVQPLKYEISAISGHDSVIASTVVVEDVTSIAAKALEDRIGLIYLKSGGRAIIKFLAAEKAKHEISQKGENKLRNVLGSLAIDLVVGATEQADIRSWRTLPAQIQATRVHLPAGIYSFSVSSSDGLFKAREISVRVRPGKTSFAIVDDVR